MSSALDAQATRRRGRDGYAADLAPQTRNLPERATAQHTQPKRARAVAAPRQQVGLFVSAAIPLTVETAEPPIGSREDYNFFEGGSGATLSAKPISRPLAGAHGSVGFAKVGGSDQPPWPCAAVRFAVHSNGAWETIGQSRVFSSALTSSSSSLALM
jgi:hypothetical protein